MRTIDMHGFAVRQLRPGFWQITQGTMMWDIKHFNDWKLYKRYSTTRDSGEFIQAFPTMRTAAQYAIMLIRDSVPPRLTLAAAGTERNDEYH